ncbi:TonB-dependent receptor [Sphingorhabdus sp. IMCC26285]|uniref:TonB-dependent receptor n=1 Tax=Sphingorhabdus profundilacus TaxID=2509718 RepID=A0A6I4M2I9_9SPHN|nr:TonB-dependent receptor [Sphingorhabdus profundilacus]MVZ96708.1 TonB-dependent receptor [Sphingorhabdus profundilacus]
MKSTYIRKIKYAAAPLAIGLGLISVPSFAQEAADAAEEDGAAIVVTGSRISVNGLTSPSPLQTLSEGSIEQSGVVNLQELLLENPAFGTPGISRTNSNFSTASAGAATVDLRNLGSARTLVLVNGRRFVAGVPGSSSVDLNTIPTQFIDRVDILTGGASAVYGSDAVAGVVNIIYKTDFEGIEAGGQVGIAEEGDDLRRQADLTFGGSFSDGRGKFMTHLGYSKEGAVFSRDREISAIDQFFTRDPDNFFKIRQPFFSSFAPQGRFFNAPGVSVGTFDANNKFILGFSTNGDATRPADGFNRSAFRTIAIPTERYLLATNASYDVSDDIEVFFEGTYAKTKTKTELEPFPLDSADVFKATGGFFNIENRQLDADGKPTGAIVVNPFVPAQLLALLKDNNGDGLRDVAFTRRLSDVALRGNRANRDTFRILGGARGGLFGDWKWDAFYSYGETSESQVSSGQFNVVNLRNALNVKRDAAGKLVCADLDAQEDGCVPVNIFGRNTISADALRFIDAPGFLSTITTQKLAGVNAYGTLGNLFGAGDIGLAVGAEYRDEFSLSEFDALQQAGLNGGNAIPRTVGSFDVYELYGEVNVPLLSETFIHSLSLTGAGRISDYSTVGKTYSYNGGVDFSPVEDIRLTAIWARSTRAPNINELFSPPSQNFPTGLIDPCEGVTAATAGKLGEVCRSFAGVNANIAQNGKFTLNQADLQGISGFDRGNPLLGEEKGDSFTARLIINPRSIDALRNFGFTASYYNIRVKDAIVSTPRQFILDQCFKQGEQSFCDFIKRRAAPEGSNSAGSLDEIDSAVTNSGGLKAEGLDFTATYTQEVFSGRLNLSLSYTHLLDGFVIPLPGSDKDFFAGEIGAAKDKFFVSANYSINKVDLTLRGTFIGESFLDDQFLAGFEVERNDPRARIPAEFYADAQIRYRAADEFEFFVGVDNLLGNDPTVIPSGLPGNTTGAETDAGTYDAIGRRFYFGTKLRF